MNLIFDLRIKINIIWDNSFEFPCILRNYNLKLNYNFVKMEKKLKTERKKKENIDYI